MTSWGVTFFCYTLAEAHPGSVSGTAKIRQVFPLVGSWSPCLLKCLHVQVLLGQHFFLNYEFECLLGKLASGSRCYSFDSIAHLCVLLGSHSRPESGDRISKCVSW